MIDYKYFELFWHKRGSVNKDWKIEYNGGSFTDWDMEDESLELTESLCSETELRFGCCEASCLKFTVANIVKPLINEWITLSVVIDHNDSEPLVIGKYKVLSEKPTADRRYKEIVAYDAMYDIISPDVADWYNSILPEENSTTTLKKFRESFIRHFGLTEVLPKDGLANDGMAVKKTIMPEHISGLDVITAICEINGCFGHIGRDGKFHYIYLPQAIQGLYPADDLFPDHAPDSMPYQQQTGHLYPQDPKGISIDSNHYIDVDWENFYVQHITKLQIRQEENDIGLIYGSGDNCYIIQDNFLVYGKSSEELQAIAENIFKKITNIVYNPLKSADVLGNPCLEVGDPVRFSTKYEIVESYILERTLKGIQALRDDYRANGVEKYSEEVNGVHNSIIQLKGKANTLTRTIEENKMEMYDIEKGLYNTITITAGEIRGELQNEVAGLSNTISVTAGEIRGELKNTKEGLETTISVTAAGIRTDVSKTYETKTDAGTEYASIRSNITQTASAIKAEVAETYETKSNAGAEYTSIRGSISLEAGRISSEIERATKSEQTLSGQISNTSATLTSKIEQTEKEINLSVSKSIEETKTYASSQAAAAQNAANASTDNKLKSYSTTTQMNSAIKIATDAIDLSVSKSIEETKTYADTKATAAKDSANASTDNKLKSYSTTTQMNAAINISAEGITSEVSKIYETKAGASAEYSSIRSSVQQNTNSITAEVFRASSAEQALSTRVSITENGLSSKVSKGDVSSEISQEAGQITLSSNRLVVDSSQFQLDSYGNATFKGKLEAASGDFSGTVTSYNGFSFIKITDASLQGGRSLWETSGYISFNTSNTATAFYGTRVAGNSMISLLSPGIAVGDWTEIDQNGTITFAQSGSTTIVTNIEKSANGEITWHTKTITFKNGLMVTAL